MSSCCFPIWLQAPAGFAFVLACPTLLHSCADATKEPAVSSGQLSEQNMLTEPDVAPKNMRVTACDRVCSSCSGIQTLVCANYLAGSSKLTWPVFSPVRFRHSSCSRRLTITGQSAVHLKVLLCRVTAAFSRGWLFAFSSSPPHFVVQRPLFEETSTQMQGP